MTMEIAIADVARSGGEIMKLQGYIALAGLLLMDSAIVFFLFPEEDRAIAFLILLGINILMGQHRIEYREGKVQ